MDADGTVKEGQSIEHLCGYLTLVTGMKLFMLKHRRIAERNGVLSPSIPRGFGSCAAL